MEDAEGWSAKEQAEAHGRENSLRKIGKRAAALLEQQQHIELASDASWLGVELVRLGRTARGEQLGNGCWRSALTEPW